MKRHKAKAEKGFFDEEQRRAELTAHNDPLRRLNEVVDWELFRPTLNQVLHRDAKGPGGRPSFDYVLMFKILILQRTFNLADEQTEFQIKDRLSFQTFLGLTLADTIPDEKTIWLFRDTLTRGGVVEVLFAQFDAHLRSRGLILNQGSIVDASFVDVPRQRNNREDNAAVKAGTVPAAWKEKPAKLAQKDVDARWTEKNGEKHFGYKDHVKVDQGSKLITAYEVTPASTHDSQTLDPLLTAADAGRPLYGDSAYSGGPQAELLAQRGVENQIHERAYRNRPLTAAQKARNREKSRVRARVEHVFGFVENSLGGFFIRSVGQRRSAGIIGLINLTYNLFRLGQLLRLRGSG